MMMEKYKNLGKNKYGITSELLFNLYKEKGLSIEQCARYIGCSKRTVNYWIDKLRIKRRSRSESARICRVIENIPKGQPPWNKGLTKEDSRVAKYSKPNPNKSLPGFLNGMFGRTHSKEARRKQAVNKGRKFSFEIRKKHSITLQNIPFEKWDGFKSPKMTRIRQSSEYRKWRQAVFERDHFRCQQCPTKGVHLRAHHIKSFVEFPELRFDVNNGKTLCLTCHRKTETYGGRVFKDKKKKRI